MASSNSYLDYIKDQLSGLEGVSWRAMMGEFILYYKGKIVGGIYDDRLLLKPTPSAAALSPEAESVLPYPGAKEMLLVEETDDRAFLEALLNAVYADLPENRKK